MARTQADVPGRYERQYIATDMLIIIARLERLDESRWYSRARQKTAGYGVKAEHYK
jgi:hypothetical protein